MKMTHLEKGLRVYVRWTDAHRGPACPEFETATLVGWSNPVGWAGETEADCVAYLSMDDTTQTTSPIANIRPIPTANGGVEMTQQDLLDVFGGIYTDEEWRTMDSRPSCVCGVAH